MSEILTPVDQFSRQLGILWRVRTQIGGTDRPQIVSDPQLREHKITLPDARTPEYDVAHELVHAKWAESVDPILSTVYFHPKYHLEKTDVRPKMQQVYYSQQLVDVWVGDVLAQLDKRLIQQSVMDWASNMEAIPVNALRTIPYETLIGYAINQADIDRHSVKGVGAKQEKAFKKLRTAFGEKAASKAQSLAEQFKALPDLPSDKKKALRMFEQQTQRSARILGFPINPQIIDHEGRSVWQIE